MECRVGCGACCIAPSITSSIPGMPNGKPAGMRCVHLDARNQCLLFESSDRPDVCVNFKASEEVCGKTSNEAMQYLLTLERLTTDKL